MAVGAVIFDMDGVLIDADDIHFEALNKAFEKNGIDRLGRTEHDLIYRGLPTRMKLNMLMQRRNITVDVEQVNADKQVATMELLEDIEPDVLLLDLFMHLDNAGYRLVVASNAVRATVETVVEKLGLAPYLSFIISNEDVSKAKPDPEMYITALQRLELPAEQAIIVEDSIPGIKAARASGAHVFEVSGVDEVNVFSLSRAINKADTPVVLVPAAGQGKRFAEVGYIYPKPLILTSAGRTLLATVLLDIDFESEVHVLLQKEHLRRFFPDVGQLDQAGLLPVDGLTEGAASTVMLAADKFDNPRELILMNSDQHVHTSLRDFRRLLYGSDADAGMLVFEDDDPKWSYAELDEKGYVKKVREKEVLPGHNATVGIYWYRRGDLFAEGARRMFEKDIRHNGEFYVAPVFNELIEMGLKVRVVEMKKDSMWGLGTPEDLDRFNAKHGQVLDA